jgi:hypothetical protein
MFRHLSLDEKIELLMGTRSSGGGLPLPEAFGAVLSYLHDSQGASTDVLKKVIRDKRQVDFREPRVLEVCGSWDGFSTAILDILERGEFIREEGEAWLLGERSVPGKELLILRVDTSGEDRRVRVRFFGEQQRRDRNAAESFKGELEALAVRARGLECLSPGDAETLSQYLLACAHLLRDVLQERVSTREDEPFLPLLKPPRKKKESRGVAKWYRNWIPTAGWHTQIEAWRAWNREHPDSGYRDPSLCPTRNAAAHMVRNGLMERRELDVNRDGAHTEYRWTGGVTYP